MNALLLTAKEAAAELGVQVETLYSYVSRGLVRSEPGPGRARLYFAEDVRALRQRDRKGTTNAQSSMGADQTAIRSALTFIDENGPHYCGRLASELARHGSLEATATLLWQCEAFNPFDREAPARPLASAPTGLRPVERAMVMISAWPLVDRSAYALHPKLVWRHGVDLCRLVASEIAGCAPGAAPIAEQIVRGWCVEGKEGRGLISMALVLCADHELNSSAYAVRVAASTGAPLHAAILAGMGAFLGPRHGAASERVDHWLTSLARESDIAGVIERQLMRAERVPGFGHFIYDGIDARAACLLDALYSAFPDHPDVIRAKEAILHVERLFGEAPNIDFALSLLKRVLDLPEGAGMALFCTGRLVGWIAHALEQYRSGIHIRPRAIYVGSKGI